MEREIMRARLNEAEEIHTLLEKQRKRVLDDCLRLRAALDSRKGRWLDRDGIAQQLGCRVSELQGIIGCMTVVSARITDIRKELGEWK